ncbi:hypothetical protein V1522DRAFT_171594 [Lipomyces starkeyi]
MAAEAPPSPTRPEPAELEANHDEKELSAPSSNDLKPEPNDDPEPPPPAPSSAQEYEWVTGWKLFMIMTAVTLVALLMLLDTSIVVTAIPRITSQFHSLADVGWYGSAYQLACAALQPLTGRIYMNLDSKWTFMTTTNPQPQPIIAVQNVLPPPQIPVATALVMFSQTFAGALVLSFSDTIFTNSLSTLVPQYAPNVDPQTIINAGATGFRSDLSGSELANVVIAYAKSVDRVFYLTTGMACGCFLFSWAMGWKDIRKKNTVSKA